MSDPAMPTLFDYLDPREYLRGVFASWNRDGRRTTHEEFSERLGFGRNSYMHQVMSGWRRVTARAAQKIVAGLALTGRDRKYLTALFRYFDATKQEVRDAAITEILDLRAEVMDSNLDRAQLEYFTEWHHAVVREMVALADFQPDPAWIAARIQPKISTEAAAASLRLLQRIGYIEYDFKQERWVQTESVVRTPPLVQSLALIRFHRQMIELGKDSVLTTPADEREIGALTMALSTDQFNELKSELQRNRRAIISKYAQDATDDAERRVFQINMQLFPLTKGA